MRIANALLGLATLCWLGFVWIGRGLAYGVYDQHVLGYPSAAQFDYYVFIPVAVVIALLALGVICNARGLSGVLKIGAALSLVSLLPYLLSYTGGV